MLRKDYIVRQFEEFGKFLAVVFGLKKDGNHEELEKVINEAAQKFCSIEIREVEAMTDEALSARISAGDLNESQLKMLGDLLYEKGLNYTALQKPQESLNTLQKASLVYRYIKENALEVDFSLDMHFKMKAIEQLLGS